MDGGCCLPSGYLFFFSFSRYFNLWHHRDLKPTTGCTYNSSTLGVSIHEYQLRGRYTKYQVPGNFGIISMGQLVEFARTDTLDDKKISSDVYEVSREGICFGACAHGKF